MTVQIDIKRTGFPVKIGNVELWFDSSAENLRNFFYIDEKVNERLKEINERAEHIHFPEGIENYSIEEFEEKDIGKIDAAFDINKESVALEYDILFGDGSFKKIYEEIPDIWALEHSLVPLQEEIERKLKEQKKKIVKERQKIENEMLEKKKQKRKK